MRAGWMAAFDTFESFQDASEDVLRLLEEFAAPTNISSKVLDALEASESGDGARLSTSINVSLSTDARASIDITAEVGPPEPFHILSIAVRGTEDMDDNQMAHIFGSFCKQNKENLLNHRVRRITFAALKK